MSYPTIEGKDNLPDHPAFICINRADRRIVQALEQTLEHVAWLLDATCMPEEDVCRHIFSKPSAGFRGDMSSMKRDAVDARVRALMQQGRHVVFITSRPSQARGSLCDLTPPILAHLAETSLPLLPIYAAYHQPQPEGALEAAEDEEEAQLCLRILPELRPGLGARLRSVWMEAAADHLAAHPLLQQPQLPQQLLQSLLRHREVEFIDGVDDSRLSYGELLLHSLLLARSLREQVNGKRLGIILPPGKRAAIANLACLLGGFSVININYELGAAEAERQMGMAGVNRFITEERFRMKLSDFHWPSERDLLNIDQELQKTVGLCKPLKYLLDRRLKDKLLLRALQTLRCLPLPSPGPEEEATILFTCGVEQAPRAVAVSHRMLMASLLQLHSRLSMEPGQRVLSALPLHEGAGFIQGLLLPLLFGYGITSYPNADAGIRLATLITENGVRLLPANPRMLHHLLGSFEGRNRKRLKATAPQLAQAQKEGRLPELFAPLRYIIVCGGALSAPLEQKAQNLLGVQLLSAYSLAEAAPMASLNLPFTEGGVTDAAGLHAPAIPSCGPGSTGAPLPGVAVRITDLSREGKCLLPGQPGLIWLKGANLARHYLGDEDPLQVNQWYATGDVGYLDDEGMLVICGRRMRFSTVSGVLVPHERLEAILNVIFHIPPEAGRKIAIVSVPDPRDGELLILLSAIHKDSADYRYTPMSYDIRNMGYSPLWTPRKLIPMNYIPTLPDGRLDYVYCQRAVCRMLGIESEEVISNR